MAVVTALSLRKHCWLLVSAIHFICCVPLGPCPRDLVGISPQNPLATEGDRRETSENYAVEKSPLYLRYFLSQINPFRMNWWTSYVLQENKLDPLSRMNGYEHYSCRNFPGHSRYLRVFSFPFCMLRELCAAKKASGYLFQGWGWAFGFLGTMCSAGALVTKFA